MKTKSTILLLAFSLAVVFSSCKKNEENIPKLSIKEKLLAGTTSKTWKITSLIGQPTDGFASALTIDFYNNKILISGMNVPNIYNIPMPEECAKDNLYIISQDKTYQLTEGASSCNTTDPDVISTGKWKFNADETILTFTSSTAVSIEYKIATLTETNIKGETTGEYTYQSNPIRYKATTTFTAQ